jgi:hypothetical protein
MRISQILKTMKTVDFWRYSLILVYPIFGRQELLLVLNFLEAQKNLKNCSLNGLKNGIKEYHRSGLTLITRMIGQIITMNGLNGCLGKNMD